MCPVVLPSPMTLPLAERRRGPAKRQALCYVRPSDTGKQLRTKNVHITVADSASAAMITIERMFKRRLNGVEANKVGVVFLSNPSKRILEARVVSKKSSDYCNGTSGVAPFWLLNHASRKPPEVTHVRTVNYQGAGYGIDGVAER